MSAEKVFRERLRYLRQEKGITQKTAAQQLGISLVGYRYYENGTRRPTFEVLPLLADFYNVSTDYLLGRSDDPHLPKLDEKTLALIRAAQAFQSEQPAAQ